MRMAIRVAVMAFASDPMCQAASFATGISLSERVVPMTLNRRIISGSKAMAATAGILASLRALDKISPKIPGSLACRGMKNRGKRRIFIKEISTEFFRGLRIRIILNFDLSR